MPDYRDSSPTSLPTEVKSHIVIQVPRHILHEHRQGEFLKIEEIEFLTEIQGETAEPHLHYDGLQDTIDSIRARGIVIRLFDAIMEVIARNADIEAACTERATEHRDFMQKIQSKDVRNRARNGRLQHDARSYQHKVELKAITKENAGGQSGKVVKELRHWISLLRQGKSVKCQLEMRSDAEAQLDEHNDLELIEEVEYDWHHARTLLAEKEAVAEEMSLQKKARWAKQRARPRQWNKTASEP